MLLTCAALWRCATLWRCAATASTAATRPASTAAGGARFWLRHTVDCNVGSLRRATHGAVHAAHADRDNRTAVGAGNRFGKRAFGAVPGRIGFDRDLLLLVDHLLIHFPTETVPHQLIRSGSLQRPIGQAATGRGLDIHIDKPVRVLLIDFINDSDQIHRLATVILGGERMVSSGGNRQQAENRAKSKGCA